MAATMNTIAPSKAAVTKAAGSSIAARAPVSIARSAAPRGVASSRASLVVRSAVETSTTGSSSSSSGVKDPLLLRAARGEEVERSPVWMMRQAGRYMKIYQDLCKRPGATTFRMRSENVDLITEISLQPWNEFRPDGVILFSDILTPLAGMNIPFDIVPVKGPIIHDPITTMAGVKEIQPLVPQESMAVVGEALKALSSELAGTEGTLLGFVGAPFTLASYIVEGGTSTTFTKIKTLAFSHPEVLHGILEKMTSSVTDYCRFQADCGAQTIQVFDSWASYLTPQDFEVFCLPYLKQIVAGVKETHPHIPVIIYASGSAGLMTRIQTAEPDIISLDMTVQMADARKVLGAKQGVQGNMDPGILFGTKEKIQERTLECLRAAGSTKGKGAHQHIMNLGHGVMVGTPEENVRTFFDTVKNANELL